MSVSALGPGGEFGEYTIESMLGRGGMATVFLAQDRRLGRQVAIKVLAEELAEDQSFRSRFIRESQLAAGLDHPNVVPVYEAGEHDGHLFIAMRYVRGTDLRTLISREGRLDPRRTTELLRPIASALDAAHRRGLVHRDVKPANILVALDEGDEHPYLSDFGLTKHAASKSGLTKTGTFMGTVDYVAPEQIKGEEVDGRTDEYSLACVMYQVLTGQVPFDKPADVATMFSHLQDPAPRVSDARPDLGSAIDGPIVRGMAKARDERYPTCTAMMQDFARAAGIDSAARDQPGFDPLVVAMAPQPGSGPMLPPAPEPAIPAVPTPTSPATAGIPSPTPPGGDGRAGGGRRLALIAGLIVAVAAVGVVAALSLGGDSDPEPGPTSVTAPTPPAAQVFANEEPIQIPEGGTATPYPSTIEVTGLSGTITEVTATLHGFGHGFPRDVDLVLAGPQGETVMLMEGTGGPGEAADVTITFDDDAPPMTLDDPLTSGTYHPTSEAGDGFGFNGPPPVPDPPYGASMSGFEGTDPNGTWSLFLFDDSEGGTSSGQITGGWSLAITVGGAVSTGASGPTAADVIFADDFSDPGSGWDVTSDQRSTTEYRDGAFFISIEGGFKTTGDFNTSTQELSTLGDVRVQANATLLTEGRDALYGVVCRAQTPLDYYYFLVGGNGKFFIGKSTEDGGAVNFDIGVSASVVRGRATNQVTAECEGGGGGSPVTLRMFVNGVAVNTLIDSEAPLATGGVGFLVESGETDTETSFDDLVVSRL